MIEKLLAFIKKHRTAAFITVELLAIGGICILLILAVVMAPPAQPTSTPTALPTSVPSPSPTPTPTAEPTVEPTPIPCPTPVPSPTVTPDMTIHRSITPLDQYALNYMVHVDKSTSTGLLSMDLANSDTGGDYAYWNDTYTVVMTLADISSGPFDRIKIHTVCRNATGTNYTIYESSRTDEVLLNPGDKVARTVGFKVPSDTPAGVYTLRIDVDAYAPNNAAGAFGCSYETGLNILKTP